VLIQREEKLCRDVAIFFVENCLFSH